MSKILHWLYLGSYKEATDDQWLKSNGINAVLNVALCTKDLEYPLGIDVLKIPLRDSPDEKISGELDIGYQYLDISRLLGRKVLVHCLAGISRSTAFVIYYLMRSNKMTLDQAYQLVKEKRKVASPNSGFLKTLYQKGQTFAEDERM